MSPWSSFPFARITLAFVGGILAARHWEVPCWAASGLLVLLLCTYILVIVGTPLTTYRFWSPWLGFLGLSGISLLGYFCWLIHEVRRDPEHLIHWSSSVEAYEAWPWKMPMKKGTVVV